MLKSIIIRVGDRMEYQVKISAFEGPMDLLLYLIKEAKISIDEVKVSEITDQYLSFIHAMEQLNLEIASEYMVMAAYLVYIKSKMILPQKDVAIDSPEYEANPEAQLKKRLKIYKVFKDLVPYFRAQEEERSLYLSKIPTDLSAELKQDIKLVPNDEVDFYDLLSAFNRILRRYNLHRPIRTKIEQQTITIDERINQVKDYFSEFKEATFSELSKERQDREFFVVTFMAVLELAKEKFLWIRQQKSFDEIYLQRVGD